MSLGPVMLDLEGPALSAEEREILAHPLVGGVILFSRNHLEPEQLAALVASIHALREPRLLVGVDHEGGRVQRFHEGFTRLPPCARYGVEYDRDAARGRALAEAGGWLMAAELRAVGVDFSFAPVLDLGRGVSSVIDDRAFHRDPQKVAELARHFMRGMREAGMAAVGKHFPGHGSVAADSHHDLPVDERPYADLQMEDLVPFERLIHAGLPGIMPAHVAYPRIDARPAGYSPVWLSEILRRQIGFQGIVFSDDLSMAGAADAGDFLARARGALDAGCDMVLICNDRAGAVQVLDGLGDCRDPVALSRMTRMHGHPAPDRATLRSGKAWQRAVARLSALDEAPELDLGDDGLT